MREIDMDSVEKERLVDPECLPKEPVIVLSGSQIKARMSQSVSGSTVPKAANTGTALVMDSMLSSVLLQFLEQQENSNAVKAFYSDYLYWKHCIVLQYYITQSLLFY